MKTLQYLNELQKEYNGLFGNKQIAHDEFIEFFFIEKAFHSSKIYGCDLSHEEVKNFLVNGSTSEGKDLVDYIIIQNTYDTIKWFHSIIESGVRLETNILKKMNIKLLEGIEFRKISFAGKSVRHKILKGEFRKPDPAVQVTNEDFPAESVNNELNILLDTLLYQNKYNFDFFSNFYYEFLRTAPFEMGNSRIIRILINYPIMKSYLLPIIFKDSDCDEYDQAILSAKSGNNSGLLNLILSKCIESYEKALHYKK